MDARRLVLAGVSCGLTAAQRRASVAPYIPSYVFDRCHTQTVHSRSPSAPPAPCRRSRRSRRTINHCVLASLRSRPPSAPHPSLAALGGRWRDHPGLGVSDLGPPGFWRRSLLVYTYSLRRRPQLHALVACVGSSATGMGHGPRDSGGGKARRRYCSKQMHFSIGPI